MSSSDDKPSRYRVTEDPLAFFGAVTASVSHELNNVISIIDQTAGLQSDMIAGEEQGIPITLERLSQSVASISKQTQRGLEIIRRLNRFAHSTDFPEMEFEINETISNLVELTRRLADLKRASLEYKALPVAQDMTGNPFILQHALFDTLRFVLGSSKRDDAIQLAVSTDDTNVLFTVSTPQEIAENDEALATIEHSLKKIAGEIKFGKNEGLSLIKLTVPLKQKG